LTRQLCNDLAHTARQLGLDTLLEIHSPEETDHINPYINIVGVNNRNLHIFKTDINTSFELADKLPDNITKISESGLSDPKDVLALRECGYNGFLMGETFMKTANPAETLNEFIKKMTL
ncbi:MAG: indole-3-glycerol-phosphate synthase TrpC, partial [Bacteroidaceae bacterium]